MRPFSILFAFCAFSLTFGGCTPRQQGYRPVSYDSVAQSELIAANYKAADTLIAQAGEQLSARHPIIVATLVNINALEESSPLGRLISEQLGARFAQQGYKVVELKLRQKLYMKRDEGELMLTRKIHDIAQQHDAQALVIGTYAESADRVFINLKLTQVETNIALAAMDYALPLDMNIRALLYRISLYTTHPS
jgi:TolB-like protein